MLEVCANEMVTYRAFLPVEYERFTCQTLLPTAISGLFDGMRLITLMMSPKLILLPRLIAYSVRQRRYVRLLRRRRHACIIATAVVPTPWEPRSNSF